MRAAHSTCVCSMYSEWVTFEVQRVAPTTKQAAASVKGHHQASEEAAPAEEAADGPSNRPERMVLKVSKNVDIKREYAIVSSEVAQGCDAIVSAASPLVERIHAGSTAYGFLHGSPS